ncbi:o-succinylbenzoate synthase [Litchfieldia alkalitelluris]|uniref:o-succinylbenzoate synthase n=1 Tax=Litchfieldia alkalitelluris TaxID=304268 RepID=UPI00099674AC|nr:o-succinylbenzoate synthase [Litchfieldia alkalitelluris]
MKIESITLYLVEQTLKTPFVTNLGHVSNRESIIIRIIDQDGFEGWGEVVAFTSPWYTEETITTCWHIIEDFLAPRLLLQVINYPSDVESVFKEIKRNHMAKAGIETALWDLYCKRQKVSLSKAIGGSREQVDAGVVVGLDDPVNMINKIQQHVEEGYKRVKIKIKPGNDYELVKRIREAFPSLSLMVDANSAYTLDDLPLLKELDNFQLLMIEQPLASDDIIDHAKVQRQLQTPICLDESIVTFDDARKAIELESCRTINIKVGRVGGLSEAVKIHNLCKKHQIPVWCGGMLEMGISRAVNIALASLDQFTIPGDISASSRYWHQDITTPEVVVTNGTISVPDGVGIGFEINLERLLEITKTKITIKKPGTL